MGARAEAEKGENAVLERSDDPGGRECSFHASRPTFWARCGQRNFGACSIARTQGAAWLTLETMPENQTVPVPEPDAPASPLGELRALATLAGPVIVSQFATNALALISTAVIGRIGQAELAAAAYGSAVYYLFFVALSGVMEAVAPRAAAAHGAGDHAGVSRALHADFRLALRLSAVMLPFIYVLSTQLWRFAPPELDTELVGRYLRIIALEMPAVLLFTALRGAMEAVGRPATVTVAALLGVLTVAVTSPALSFGWGPLPALGLAGAAAATTLAGWMMFLALHPLVMRHMASLDRRDTLAADVRSLFALG